ncbi:MAG TPA: glycosyltransferase family 2 protein [Solirubrobacteraceae bacterium]|jgi:N-acetylglucosaminyl-diphospho-decaprenol L-rhamnosyltransferase|nr:glycosyltransferase family 2 protein [Solirubrobacteraceae bacterium]
MRPTIDVVVPAYDHYQLTSDCLRHLREQSVEHRVIVVDDGSSDGTPARLRSEWPQVTVVELGANGGYTRAVNRGVSEGDGEYVVLLNNDVQLRPDCLKRLVAPMTADPKVGSVAALMLRPGGTRIDSFGVTADATLAGFARLQGHPPGDARSGAPVLTGPEGTAGAYRRRAWEQVGGLDETIVAYMEILDLALRLRSAGWSTVGAPDAVGIHLGSATYGRRSSRQRRLAGFSRGYLIRRYGVLRGRAAVRTLVTEAAVVAIDLLSCRDAEALGGRVQGWHAASGRAVHARPPREAIDWSISLWRSLMLRRGAYGPAGGD